jgi:3-mercaptopyruvate sulfurtransferase SseA
MIETFFGLDRLGSSGALFASLLIGILFGFCLERAGFGSSRRLSGIFYFRDMAVLKVMFSALVTAMLGLSYLLLSGWVSFDQLFFMPTLYGAHIIGGLIFGAGFAMSGWCPGTGAVGLASGKVDALVFLAGVLLGSIFFNELFPLVKPLYSLGERGVLFVYDSLGMSRAAFALLLTLAAVGAFWGSEYLEKRKSGTGIYFNSPFLRAFSIALVVLAGGLFIFPSEPASLAAVTGAGEEREVKRQSASTAVESELLQAVESGGDHMGVVELADRLVRGDTDLVLVDVRTEDEFRTFHIRGALNVPLARLMETLHPYKNKGMIVLYSNGMTHPAQARDALARLGYRNAYILTDGLQGFIETCLKPASLRSVPLTQELASRINAWRAYFTAQPAVTPARTREVKRVAGIDTPSLVDTEWAAANLGRMGLKVIDLRSQPEYNTRHIPGSMALSVESLRGMVKGIPSMLLPAAMLALHMSLMGIEPSDTVLLVYGERPHDATLAGMAFERLGHKNWAVMNGGFGKWMSEGRATDALLPVVAESKYPAGGPADGFTVGAGAALQVLKEGKGIILDVRPAEYYAGKKSEEARAGHIPGAKNRPFSEDVIKKDGYSELKPRSELESAYAAIIPAKDTRVIVHCRTGHQASQTFFVLKDLLGYTNVLYYDAGWTEWAARAELPVETGEVSPPAKN